MEITKREIIVSITIVVIMLLIGLFISDKISDYQMEKNDIYNKAIKIDSQELFQYGMDTNIGNAFIYGKLKAIDTVTYPEIGTPHMYIEKVKERYTRHTRRVTTTVNGKSHTRTEVYYSWDRVGSESKKCNEVSFCDIMFKSNKINLPDTYYIETQKESLNIRYKYYGLNTEYDGTLFTQLKDKNISDNSSFYKDMTIEQTVDYLESGIGLIIFWIVWVGLTISGVILFYKFDNDWLE